jgi:hypothetical protein
MIEVHQVAIVTPLTMSAGAVLCTIFIHALALGATGWTSFAVRQDQAGLVCDWHSGIRTYDLHPLKVQGKGPDKQSKGRNDCTLDIRNRKCS